MCGIVGLIDNERGMVPQALLHAMRDVMEKRGPDGTGEFIEGSIAMAMRRLSIIDLEHGWQPLTSRNGRVVAFQNGEIYNFKQLRAVLEGLGIVFKTNSDTEVLAHGYAYWGIEDLLHRIDGMYAFAILDRDRRELHLARDRFGEKPLFYYSSKKRFAYASDIRALSAMPWTDTEIDQVALDRYLALHYVPGERTILRDIKRVLPGEHLRINLDHLIPKHAQYYQIPIGTGHHVSDHETVTAIENAVTSRLIADVPVGIFLSGGLDSSIVAAVAARKNPEINTFSMGFHTQKHDESNYARQVAEHIGSTHHHFMFDEARFAELLPQVASAMDEPVGDQALLPLFWLCREARQHVKVVLSGEGADEVFAGYGYYTAFASQPTIINRARALVSHSPTICGQYDLRRLVHNTVPVTPSGFPLLTDTAGREELLGEAYTQSECWEEKLIHWLDGASDALQRATCADLATWLPDDLLVKTDRMAMANGLEGRAPFLDPKVVDIGLRGIPYWDRMARGESKIALRRIARQWLPAEILARPKQGFVLPMREWLIQWFDVNGGPYSYFQRRPFSGMNMERISDLVADDLRVGVRRERLLFALLLLCEWYAAFSQRVAALRVDYIRAIAQPQANQCTGSVVVREQ